MKFRNSLIRKLIFFMTLALFSRAYSQTHLPFPTGPYNVGVLYSQLNDYSRNDLLNDKKPRRIPVAIYYPTLDTSQERLDYIENKKLLSNMIAYGYNHQDSIALFKMARNKMNSIPNATIIANTKFPLMLFSHGLGVSKQNYALFFQEWASQGYVVVAMDHPYGGFTLFSDGQLATSRQDTLLTSESKSYLLKTLDHWADDISLAIREITSSSSPLGKQFAHIIDEEKIVAIGHSLGGNAAVLASYKDDCIRAAINMDGGTFKENIKRRYTQPILTLRSQPVYSDEELLKKGRNRMDWDKMGKEIDAAFESAMSGAALGYELKISGAGHMSFSDAPFVLPDMITRFGGKIIDKNRCFVLINKALQVFLQSISDHNTAPLAGLLDQYPETTLKIYRNR